MLGWIVGSGVLMMAIVLVGPLGVALLGTRPGGLRPLVGLAVGTLVGGALLHLLPAAVHHRPSPSTWGLAGVGFLSMVAVQAAWSRAADADPLSGMVLLGDALHNAIGGFAVAASFLVDVQVGVAAWIAAAAHEIPQELGDHAVLVERGMSSGRALAWNALSAATFPLAGVATWVVHGPVDTARVVPLAAGQFLYLAAVLAPAALEGLRGATLVGVLGMMMAGLGVMEWVPHGHG